MEHAEFVQSWNAGKLEIDVDRSKALQVAGSNMLPKRYQVAHIFWSWVWMLSIPAALTVMYFYTSQSLQLDNFWEAVCSVFLKPCSFCRPF
jgi:hypothetical protein